MKARLLSFATRKLRGAMLMLLTLVSLSASAEWLPVELNTLYEEPNIWNNQTDFKFTPAESGSLTIWSQDAVMHVYTQLTADETDLVYDSQISSFGYAENTFQGTTFGKRTVSDVEAGKTYYITSGKGFSKGMKFYLSMQTGVSSLEITSCNQPVGEMFNISDERDGQLELEFNLPATADAMATLECNGHVNDTIETRQDINTGKIIFRLKEALYEWMQQGYFQPGDKCKLTITGLCARTNSDIKYGQDGTLVMEWLVPSKPHYLLSIAGATPFYSYWVEGDERGIVTLTFDYPLMTMEDGQTATVQMLIGSADAGDVWEGELPKEKITVDGEKLKLDFTGIRRSYEDLGLKTKWSTMDLKVFYIKMADGTSSFSESSGNYGSAQFSRSFKELKSDIVAEFTPVSGSVLQDKQFKVYFSDKEAYKFGGVDLYYQTLEDEQCMIEVREGITSVEEGESGIEYTIPVPDEVFAGKNIRVKFSDVVSTDGFDHDFGVKYNPGPELLEDFYPVSTNVKDGDVVSSLTDIRLTFDEKANIVAAGGVMPLYVTDLTTQQQVQASMSVDPADDKTIVITPEETLKDCHKYEFWINYSVIANDEYVETKEKYGRYYIGETFTITLNKLYADYPFAADPLAGATVDKLSKVAIYTKPGADYATELISPTRREDRSVFVVNEAGDTVTTCTVKDDVQDGFSLNLAEAITASGKYFVVMQDSVFNMGEGYTVETNDREVRIPYTVLSAPKAAITVDNVDPANEATVDAISEVVFNFSEWVYAKNDTCMVDVFNKTTYKFFTAPLAINPRNRNRATITFLEPITEPGAYTFTLNEASVGDENWLLSEGMTGNMNETFNYYLTVKDPSQGGSDVDSQWRTTPAYDTTIESLHEVHVWNDNVSELGCGSGKVVVKRDGVELEQISDAAYGNDWNELVLTTSQEYTEDGTYTFEVPEGFFVDGSGNALPAVTFTWTIGASQQTSDYTTSPANGTTVESLREIHVWNNTVSEMGCGNGKIVVKRDGVELEQISDAAYGNDWNELVLTTSQEYTEAGVYTFEVPEGFFVDGSGAALPAVTFTWTISGGTAINGIAADGKTIIYTIDGRQSATLRRGINIVGGKKIVVK